MITKVRVGVALKKKTVCESRHDRHMIVSNIMTTVVRGGY